MSTVKTTSSGQTPFKDKDSQNKVDVSNIVGNLAQGDNASSVDNKI